MFSTVRFCARLAFVALALVATTNRATAQAQSATASRMSKDELAAFAKVHVAISVVHDSLGTLLAGRFNTTESAQKSVRDSLQARIGAILHHSGMSEAEYQKKTYIVGTDGDIRKSFDSLIAKLTGVPTPGQVVGVAVIAVPAGPVGTHIGHVVNTFNGAPDLMGLLPTALAEARIAITHAALGARQPGNLEYMKLHAGHVINALDPSIVAAGPGRGYGAKKAAQGVADHIALAAKAEGASQHVILHASHVGTSARNVVTRCEQAIVLAKDVQSATTVEEAAKAMSQLVSITEQLVAGYDANSDGKVTWEAGEGGLQQAQEHVTLMLAGETKGGQ